MVRGEVYFLDFSPRSGSEQSGRRPGIIVSHDSFNGVPTWHSITVIPLTTSPRWMKPSPTTVLFKKGECGLSKDGVALAHQVTTVDKSELLEPPLGRATGAKLDEVDLALKNYLSL